MIAECRNLTKQYGTDDGAVLALDNVSLSIEQKSFTAITGASGCGKSTLLHLLGTVDTPTSGSVIINETDTTMLSEKEKASFRRRTIGLIYQFYNLVPTLSVKQNILLPLYLDKKKPDTEYFDYLVRTVQLTDKLDKLPHQISGGQQQKTAIVRSLLYKPMLLLADEPTGNLDRKNAQAVMDLLKMANTELNQTIVLVTHDEQIASQVSSILTMQDGRIVQ